MRAAFGQAGIDRAGFWQNAPDEGLQMRVGEVSQELLYSAAERGDDDFLREVRGPVWGFFLSKTF